MSIELFQVNLQETGIALRDKERQTLPFSSLTLPDRKKIKINADILGDYNITQEMLSVSGHHEFFDNDVKILDWYSDNNQIIIKGYTSKQINITVDLLTKKCQIKALGPLLLEGKLVISNILQVEAEAICFAEEVKCDGVISLGVQQSIGFLGDVTATYLEIEAAYIQQSANFHIVDALDIAAQIFKQEPHYETVTDSLRLLATQAEIAGNLKVTEQCLITSNAIFFGAPEVESTIKLVGKNYLHFAHMKVHGDTQIAIGDLQKNELQYFIVDHQLIVDTSSKIFLTDTHFSAETVFNHGELSIEYGDFEINNIHQNGIFDTSHSKIFIHERFAQGKVALSEFKNTDLKCRAANIAGGKFTLSQSDYNGHNFSMFSGSFAANNNSKLSITESMLFSKDSFCELINCEINVQFRTQFYGETNFQQASIQASFLRFLANKVSINQSKIQAHRELNIAHGADINASKITGNIIKLCGNLSINRLQIYSKYLDITTEHAKATQLYISCQDLALQGSAIAEQVIFSKCSVTTKRLTSRAHITMDESVIHGIDKRDIIHHVEEEFIFRRSRLITESSLKVDNTSHLSLSNYSSIRTGPIYSEGEINADDSSIHCEALHQEQAELTLQSSQLIARDGFYSRASKTKLKQHAVVMTTTVRQDHKSQLSTTENSTLLASQAIIIDPTSTVTGHTSTIATKKFVALGRAELCSSLLSAEELFIFNQFDAQKNSKIIVEGQLAVAKEANVTIDETHVAAHDIHSFGKVTANDSILAAKNSVSMWSSSTSNLHGSTAVAADTMILAGALTTGASPRAISEEEKKKDDSQKRAPQIIVNQKLTITADAKITGDAKLSILADEIKNSGTIDLSATLQAVGNTFTNHGSVNADTMHLGFDDYVLNWGALFAKNMTIHSNFINLLGGVFARESYSCAGFYGLNFGLIAANSYDNSTLFSMNAGLITPNIAGDAAYIFSTKNLKSALKSTACMALPGYTNTINLVFMLPELGKTACKIYDSYEKFDWEKLKAKRRHEWMPLLGQVKNTSMFAWGACNSTYGTASELSTLSSDFTAFTEHLPNYQNFTSSQFLEAAHNVNWEHVTSGVGAAFLGNYTDASLLHLNVGGSFAACTQKTSLLTINSGIEASLFAHTINTRYLFNEGLSVGGEAVFLADTIYNSGTMEGTRQFTLKADKMVNATSGVVDGTHVNVDIKKLDQEGDLTLHSGQAKIEEFHDTTQARTSLTDMLVTGSNLHESGHLDATHVQFKYTGAVTMDADSASKMDNVAIEANKVLIAGHLDYQHTLAVKANQVHLQESSVVNGAKTADDQLFVPKEAPSKSSEEAPKDKSSNDNAAEPPKEPEKEFKPQHVLVLEAKRIVFDGQLSGGDYAQIQGQPIPPVSTDGSSDAPAPTEVTKCEKLEIGDTANIDLKHGSIAAQDADISGRAHLDGFNINIDHTRVSEAAAYSLANSVVKGDTLVSVGTVDMDHCAVQIAHIDLGQQAKELITDSTIETKEFKDSSQMQYQGQVSILTDHYDHAGAVNHAPLSSSAEDKNLFYVKAKTADLHGAAGFDNAFFNIEHFDKGVDLVAGRGIFSQYQARDSFGFETLDSFHSYGPINRTCDIMVKANDILIQADLNLAHRLSLISTVGDVSLLSNLSTDALYVQSARNIWMNHSLYANSVASFEAKGGLYNLGGTLNADTVAVKASEIKNISAGSTAAGWSWGYAMGGAGIINGRKNTYLEATQGNIENHGGIIRAGEYTQLLAHGDVINTCNVRSIQGAYDVIQQFDAGLIAGGSGAATEGVGLYIKADGRVVSDASDFISNGANYIEADQGFAFTARQHTYVSDRWTTKKHWWSSTKHHEETTTTVKGTVVQSSTGINILRTEHGGVNAVAAQFISPGGTEVYARDDVRLYSLKSTNYTHDSSSGFLGLSKHSSTHKDQSSTPTLFWDNGVSRITSSQGSIDARGAYFGGAGDLYMKAKGRIQFGLDILDHEVHDKSQTFGFSAPGVSAFQAGKQSGKFMDAITAEDATVAKINAMLNSGNSAELLANSANLGINLYNTTNSAMRGLAQGSLSDELMARYGLGGAKGFSPALTLSMTKSDTKAKYQTLSQGGVDRGGNVVLDAGEGIDLENGVRVHAAGNMEVIAPEIIASAAALHSSSVQKTTTESISVNVAGEIQDAAVSASINRSTATQHVNAELSANGSMSLHSQDGAMHRVVLDGANIQAKTLDADIDRLEITDKQDTMTTHTASASASLSGAVSVYQGHGSEKVTHQQSGIHVVDGINTDGHRVHVTEAEMHGGKITTDDKNAIVIDRLKADKMLDEQHHTGIGISGNVNDPQRLANGQPSNEAGEQAIAIAEISVDHSRRRVEQTPVIFGAQGTQAEIGELQGEIHTNSAVGSRTLQDEQLHLKLDVPITNGAYLAKSSENIRAGMDVIAAALARPNPTDIPRPGRHDESALPSKREEDELQLRDGERELPPEAVKKIAELAADLNGASSELKQAIADDIAAIQASTKNTGKADPKIQHRLQENYKLALWQTFKLYAEESWGEFSKMLGPENSKSFKKLLSEPDGLSKIGVKASLGARGLGLNFILNLGTAYIDSSADHQHLFREAMKESSKDAITSIIIRLAVGGELAGPVGIFVAGAGVIDTLTYDEKVVQSLFDQAAKNSRIAESSRRSGKHMESIFVESMASRQIDSAGVMCAWHMLFSQKFSCFDDKNKSSMPPTPQQFDPKKSVPESEMPISYRR